MMAATTLQPYNSAAVTTLSSESSCAEPWTGADGVARRQERAEQGADWHGTTHSDSLNDLLDFHSSLQYFVTSQALPQLPSQQHTGGYMHPARPCSAPAPSTSLLAPTDDLLSDVLTVDEQQPQKPRQTLLSNDSVEWNHPFKVAQYDMSDSLSRDWQDSPAATYWPLAVENNRRGSSLSSASSTGLALWNSTNTTPATSHAGSQRSSFSLNDSVVPASLDAAASACFWPGTNDPFAPICAPASQVCEALLAFDDALQHDTLRSTSQQPTTPHTAKPVGSLAQRPETSLGLPSSSLLASGPAQRHTLLGPTTSTRVSAVPLFAHESVPSLTPTPFTTCFDQRQLDATVRLTSEPQPRLPTSDLPLLNLGEIPSPLGSLVNEQGRTVDGVSPSAVESLSGIMLSKDAIPPLQTFTPLYGSPGKAVTFDEEPRSSAVSSETKASESPIATAFRRKKDRSTVACNPCRKSKRKCDGDWPCASCRRRKDHAYLHCTYEQRVSPGKRPAKVNATPRVKKKKKPQKRLLEGKARVMPEARREELSTAAGGSGTMDGQAAASKTGPLAQDLWDSVAFVPSQPLATFGHYDPANARCDPGLAPPTSSILPILDYASSSEINDLFSTALHVSSLDDSAGSFDPELTPLPSATPCFAPSIGGEHHASGGPSAADEAQQQLGYVLPSTLPLVLPHAVLPEGHAHNATSAARSALVPFKGGAL